MLINIFSDNMLFDSNNDRDFFNRNYQNGLDPYINRLKQYRFEKMSTVLDAGCGFGQWSLALSLLNENIYACDVADNRISILNKIASNNDINNIHTAIAGINNLPYENEYFDAVFCYGVIFITPWKKSLSELVRVLKKGGKLYVNANGLGWYKHLWYTEHNKTKDYDPQLIAANAWRDTYLYNNNSLELKFPCNLIIEPHELITEANNLGIYDIIYDGEGQINHNENSKPFFATKYLGDIGIYELIGIKR